jgi:hypothetical protein
MKRPGCAALTAALYGTTIGCASGGGSDARIDQVTPAAAYSDAPFSITIVGAGFRPAYDIDTTSGSASIETGGFSAFLAPPRSSGLPRVQATGLAWQSASQLVAEFPTGIAGGSYDVGVHDPRGRDTIKAGAFVSLGRDLTPPVVTILQPASGTLVGADTDVVVSCSADDGAGTVTSFGWTVTDMMTGETISASCPVGPSSGRQFCQLAFTPPTPASTLDLLSLDAVAYDRVGLKGSSHSILALAPRSTVTSVEPRLGPMTGGTPIDVEGTNFLDATSTDPGTQIVVDGQPIPTTFVGTTSLIGLAPAHDPGEVPISVITANAETDAGTFTFIAPAVVRLVSPSSGPPAGGTPVAIVGDNFRDGGTTIWFGGTPLACQRFVSPNRIEGFAPSGTGTVGVAALDPVVNGNVLPAGFTYLDGAGGGTPPDTDGGPPPDAGCGGTGSGP